MADVGLYIPASPEPSAVPGVQRVPFDFAGSDFSQIGWSPDGQVYFSYTVTVTPNAAGFTTNGGSGCDTSTLRPKTIEPCFIGNSVF